MTLGRSNHNRRGFLNQFMYHPSAEFCVVVFERLGRFAFSTPPPAFVNALRSLMHLNNSYFSALFDYLMLATRDLSNSRPAHGLCGTPPSSPCGNLWLVLFEVLVRRETLQVDETLAVNYKPTCLMTLRAISEKKEPHDLLLRSSVYKSPDDIEATTYLKSTARPLAQLNATQGLVQTSAASGFMCKDRHYRVLRAESPGTEGSTSSSAVKPD
ncbi:hypothetical protein RF11_09171 [Thelohanellus kitauei]|uniref:Uncharacterized protein n=1 Tax=Thelohanellus kitauei TaxID=669202 RepID=A0A0C2NB70_THEKT|nr:hypothetical protein RF11_09171 [Thelohanellus kitauei]